MSDVLAASPTCFNGLSICKSWKKQKLKWQCGATLKPPLMMMMMIRTKMVNCPSTYSSRISTDIPLYELPGASFDHYLEDKPRVFRAIFPDEQRSQQLNEEQWRINMLPVDFLFLTVKPIIDMRVRCKSEGIEYPPGVPSDITKVVELEIIRWELQGLDDVLKPSHFSLEVEGVLYPDRRGPRTRLRGRLQMAISFILPAVLSLIPEEVRQQVAESVLRRLMENMKSKVNGSLLADYSTFKREKSIKLV
ncbi:hypothetical protein ACH5RR_011201 [Cinchona calisaya]|uniref:Uncharacterized protein n=1 Tax=Cinchona calisaya TaxID=153742 RepID=A0ABD3A7R2_9GENT